MCITTALLIHACDVIPHPQIQSHRMDGKYFMSGSKVGLKSRYQVDGNELDLLKDLSKVRRGAPHYGRGLR